MLATTHIGRVQPADIQARDCARCVGARQRLILEQSGGEPGPHEARRGDEAGVLLGLVTGNIEAAAHIKLARAGLNRFFSFGGYGSDSNQRAELTRRALERGKLVSGGVLSDGSAISVGDTPRDVAAGHGAGIEVVGVATGNFSVEELRQAGANWAIPEVGSGFPV